MGSTQSTWGLCSEHLEQCQAQQVILRRGDHG